MVCVLLDSSVLIAVSLTRHLHHDAANTWLGATEHRIATCPITEGSLVREVVRGGDGFTAATDLLQQIASDPRHEFWVDDVPFTDVRTAGLVGHKQVTDAYLAQLARHNEGKVATLDRAMAALHPDVAELVPTS